MTVCCDVSEGFFCICLDADGLLSQALLTGNFEAAVEICLCENKMAEAIILAIAGGPDLLSRTQKRFFQQSKCSIGRVWKFLSVES
jgi:protein transport protein SEC31